jgi:hypothetical protein
MRANSKSKRLRRAAVPAVLALSAGFAAAADGALAPLPLDKSVSADVGTVHLFLGPAGQKDVPVDAYGTVRVHVDGNPLFVTAIPEACDPGQVGVKVRVTTNGGPATATVYVSKGGQSLVRQNVSIPAIDTQDIGACADVSAIVR